MSDNAKELENIGRQIRTADGELHSIFVDYLGGIDINKIHQNREKVINILQSAINRLKEWKE
jgi:hypothetical protein